MSKDVGDEPGAVLGELLSVTLAVSNVAVELVTR